MIKESYMPFDIGENVFVIESEKIKSGVIESIGMDIRDKAIKVSYLVKTDTGLHEHKDSDKMVFSGISSARRRIEYLRGVKWTNQYGEDPVHPKNEALEKCAFSLNGTVFYIEKPKWGDKFVRDLPVYTSRAHFDNEYMQDPCNSDEKQQIKNKIKRSVRFELT